MTTKKLNIILAATIKGEIGYRNTIPWNLKADLSRFKMKTMGHVVIMGRKTFESLRSPLTDRQVIVVSSTLMMSNDIPDKYNDVTICSNFQSALEIADMVNGEEVFVAGGVRLYQEAMALPCRLFLTTVHKESPHGYDAIIPNFNVRGFEYDSPPTAIYDTDPLTGLMNISHTYSVLTNTNL